ncbi:RHS repeat-associated core domain-containing protein, partial [Escherichia coli]|uniref:RHS repeat-associated core domain-containing protein n=1 Tax=Escherichia coli TaxID=562 RepID=UPI0020230BCA
CGEYDEWGNLLGETSAQHLQQSLRLPGQQYDEESGLYYNRNRYYDPLQGRYITQDPIGLKGGWNLYAYPLNPVQRGDPLGKASALTAVITRVGNWSVRRMRRGGRPVMSTVPQATSPLSLPRTVAAVRHSMMRGVKPSAPRRAV